MSENKFWVGRGVWNEDLEKYLVEITRDGELLFLDYDIEYDLSMSEFGEPKSQAVTLFEHWKQNEIRFIARYLRIPNDRSVLIAMDWGEHVLPIFKKTFPRDQRPWNVIRIAREFVSGKRLAGELIDATETLRHFVNEEYHKTSSSAHSVAEAIVFAASTFTGYEAEYEAGAVRQGVVAAATAAANAAAYSAPPKTAIGVRHGTVIKSKTPIFAPHIATGQFVEWDEAFRRERLWQIRRFLDVESAFFRGKPWPPLKETK